MKPRNDFAKKYKVPRNTVRYSAKKGAVREHSKRMNKNPQIIKSITKRLAKKGIAISLATALIASGATFVVHKYLEENDNPIPVEEVIKNENDMEKLGIIPEDYQELQISVVLAI